MQLSFQERLESVKAGCLGAIAFGLVYALAWLGNSYFSLLTAPNLDWLTLALNGGSGLLSGFLFAVTYRYIIRQDNNAHLRDGAVLAFTLVRSGGLIELPTTEDPLAIAILMGESLISFAVVRSTLDWAMARGWLRPFNG
ncbi:MULTISPECIES: hypothetical protein [unclassified Synechocystis]|uniref:hypothetical protein n=1 Tax=unclassified Synechocystis TaxID=2640012 RepID=UPI00040578DD|nr:MULTISPECIES: hypothetical protein [unclassified Synechocystis]AIE72811.1 hypothetical protein D082_02820 [Synechocystis sp. PCC 6714]MCT0254554.1 hypothetical protein [Synechocystis sp. CS-94]